MLEIGERSATLAVNQPAPFRPALLGRDFVLPRAGGLKGLYLDCFGVPDVRLQLSALYLYQTLSKTPFHSLLDVGCGNGCMTTLMAKAFPQSAILGIDRDTEGVAYGERLAAQNHCDKARFQALDIESDFPAGQFDVITCMAVLQFIEDTPALLKKFSAALQPGGRLLMQVPLVNDLGYLMKLSGASRRMPVFHEARAAFTEAEITDGLAQSGLEVIEFRPIIKGLTILAKELFYLSLSLHAKAPVLFCPLLNRLTAFDAKRSGAGQGAFIIAKKSITTE
jgi:2-polyprenyl-3-methyl-5-hydroxy-6-metoxy-1,4-benzoquinol methylase